MAENKPVIWLACEADYFFRGDWTGQISLKWQEKSGCTRTVKLIRPRLLTSSPRNGAAVAAGVTNTCSPARDCYAHDRETFVVSVLFQSGG
jgi:hypothetical protein